MAGYQPYPEYKDSGVEWLGVVPTSWEPKRLRFALRTNPSSKEIKLSPDALVSFVVMDAVGEYGGLRLDEEKELIDVGSGYTYFANDDVVVAKITPCYENGKGALVEGLTNGVAFGTTELHVLRSGLNLHPPFLFYITISNIFRNLGESEMYGAGGQKRVPESFIKDFVAALPTLQEQQTIARFLDQKTAQIDALIAKKEALLEKLAEKRTALISHAVTKGLNPQAKMKDSGVEWLGQVPEHWEVKKLKFFVTAYGGGTPNTSKPEYWDGDIPWVSPKDMKSELIGETEDYLTELGVLESATRLVPIDSVLIVVRSGILRHTIPVARNLVVVSLNQDMKALIPNKQVEASFLHRLIQGNQKGLLPLWSKAGCTVESIEYSYMANTEIGVPPANEQQAIVEYIDIVLVKLDRQTSKAQQAIEKLKEYRSALITQAVTGKIDVRDIEVPVISGNKILEVVE